MDRLRVVKFDPSQPRDPSGRWTGDGASVSPRGDTEGEAHNTSLTRHSLALALRVGFAANDVNAALASTRALRDASGRREIAIHLTNIAAAIVALNIHVAKLPETARAFTAEARAALHRTKASLLKLKRRLFAERAADSVGKIAREIGSLMASATP
jgi:hypothetical protein